jgi:precorrin-2 dehydrogenase/sirohydrochlorin ferrochelatase
MQNLYYPIALKLKDRNVLVVGGGQVAERKIKNLLRSGAKVRVVSPELTAPLAKLARARRIDWLNNVVRASDLKGIDLVIAATSEAAVNKNISEWAKRRGLLVNVVDRASLSSFISPAVFRASRATIAVYTDGRDPVLSRDLKNFLKENWGVFLSYRNRL